MPGASLVSDRQVWVLLPIAEDILEGSVWDAESLRHMDRQTVQFAGSASLNPRNIPPEHSAPLPVEDALVASAFQEDSQCPRNRRRAW